MKIYQEIFAAAFEFFKRRFELQTIGDVQSDDHLWELWEANNINYENKLNHIYYRYDLNNDRFNAIQHKCEAQALEFLK